MKVFDNITEIVRDDMLHTITKGSKLSIAASCFSMYAFNELKIDLKNQLELAYEGDQSIINEKLNTKKSIDDIFRQAQTAFNSWSRLKPEMRTTEALLRTLDFDFFEVLDSVTIARSRRHIEKYYNTEQIGRFPERLKPISKRPGLIADNENISYDKIYAILDALELYVYTPSDYFFDSKLSKYLDLTHNKGNNLTQSGREQGIKRLIPYLHFLMMQ